jgi:cystathionine beta-lyase
MKKDTSLLNSGRKPEDHHGIVNPPVYHASTVIRASVEAYEKA